MNLISNTSLILSCLILNNYQFGGGRSAGTGHYYSQHHHHLRYQMADCGF
ncbi:MAG: hypothetical protein AB8B77_08995 [Alphaproteobacteria bacterium]